VKQASQLEDLLQRLERLAADYGMRVDEALASDSGVPADMIAVAQASKLSVKQAAALFEERVVVAETLDAPWPAF
ncbi:hypothetical protein PpSQ1_27185, partial [Pseudomonas putida]